ncbi:MAG: hypothetical protein WD469_06095 [Paenibacillaceae bacterium]
MVNISLQATFEDFNCILLNYTNNKILVTFFYSEERYEDFLNGVNCIQGSGVYRIDQILEFNKLDDGKLVVVQNDGIEIEKYKFLTLFKATIEYKDSISDKNKSLTLRIRKHVFNNRINLFDEAGNSLDFDNIIKVKNYLSENFGKYKIIDWNVYVQ